MDRIEEDSYAAALLAAAEAQSKGQRTRAAILSAACEALEGTTPDGLRVAELCRAAGISNGTFYLYFEDRDALLSALLAGFIAYLQARLRAGADSGGGGGGDPLRAATARYVRLFRLNRGLMRCLVHHHDQLPQARAAFHRLNHDWLTRVAGAAALQREKAGADPLPQDEALRRAYALGGMVDQYLSGLWLSRDPSLIAVSGDEEAVIGTLTHIWKKGMEG
ncbi:TetR/AcrR family transcriptional regulator [Roseibacterium beibuensis]|uniref:TetR/AcrR family transcriptional regulator n=1 Tax=[Roseibacterium] beibuensis TaxID=1193142 RepID=UPI0031EC6B87|nr:TetR/AcrR family transcriptional regulator [Roseibacterium beibuensis]